MPIQNKKIKEQYIENTKNNAVAVTKNMDAVTIKGINSGEIIKVYSVTGTEIKSIVSNNDEVKIKLPTNQMYIINIGQARYKVAL